MVRTKRLKHSPIVRLSLNNRVAPHPSFSCENATFPFRGRLLHRNSWQSYMICTRIKLYKNASRIYSKAFPFRGRCRYRPAISTDEVLCVIFARGIILPDKPQVVVCLLSREFWMKVAFAQRLPQKKCKVVLCTLMNRVNLKIL